MDKGMRQKVITIKRMKEILKQKSDDLQAVLIAFVAKNKKPKVVYDDQYRVYSNGYQWFTRDDFIKNIKK
jgi:vacuolar-type H+-ATPase subunit D/Vma8